MRDCSTVSVAPSLLPALFHLTWWLFQELEIVSREVRICVVGFALPNKRRRYLLYIDMPWTRTVLDVGCAVLVKLQYEPSLLTLLSAPPLLHYMWLFLVDVRGLQ